MMIDRNREQKLFNRHATLAEAIDRVIEKGASIQGDVAISVAEIDLIILGLRLVIASAPDKSGNKISSSEDKIYIREMERRIRIMEKNISRLVSSDDPQKVEKGIAKLVLTLVALITDLMEREAMRKINRGAVSKTKAEKLGVTFVAIKKKLEEMKNVFGIKEDLNIDLGPLGQLI